MNNKQEKHKSKSQTNGKEFFTTLEGKVSSVGQLLTHLEGFAFGPALFSLP